MVDNTSWFWALSTTGPGNLTPMIRWLYKINSLKHGILVRVHPRKLTCLLKRDYFNRKCFFQPLIFRGHVSFWGGIPFVNFSAPEFLRKWPLSLYLFAGNSVKKIHIHLTSILLSHLFLAHALNVQVLRGQESTTTCDNFDKSGSVSTYPP